MYVRPVYCDTSDEMIYREGMNENCRGILWFSAVPRCGRSLVDEKKSLWWLRDRIRRFLQSSLESISGGSQLLLLQRDCRPLRPLGRYLDRFQENPQICGGPTWLNISRGPSVFTHIAIARQQQSRVRWTGIVHVNVFDLGITFKQIILANHWNDKRLSGAKIARRTSNRGRTRSDRT